MARGYAPRARCGPRMKAALLLSLLLASFAYAQPAAAVHNTPHCAPNCVPEPLCLEREGCVVDVFCIINRCLPLTVCVLHRCVPVTLA